MLRIFSTQNAFLFRFNYSIYRGDEQYEWHCCSVHYFWSLVHCSRHIITFFSLFYYDVWKVCKLYILSFNSFYSGYCTFGPSRKSSGLRAQNLGWIQVILCKPRKDYLYIYLILYYVWRILLKYEHYRRYMLYTCKSYYSLKKNIWWNTRVLRF